MRRAALFATRYFDPRVYMAAYGLLAALVVWALLGLVGERHERKRAEVRACEAEWGALRARNPWLARVVVPVDKCVALRMVAR